MIWNNSVQRRVIKWKWTDKQTRRFVRSVGNKMPQTETQQWSGVATVEIKFHRVV